MTDFTDFDSPASAQPSIPEQAGEAFRNGTRTVADAIDAAKQPDMPLDVLTPIVREAPVASLITVFLLGYMIARR